MPRHYSHRPLTEKEWREIEVVLLNELDIQAWFGVAFLPHLGGEVFLTIQ